MKPEKTGRKQGKFRKGESGNPKGRPAGARNKTTIAALALLNGEAQALTRKAIDAALDGDMQALRLCLERIVPPAKDRPVNVKLPAITDAADLPKVTMALLSAVGDGEICPSEAATLAKLIEMHRGALEMTDILERIKKLEAKVKK